jgi:hypothetical protein
VVTRCSCEHMVVMGIGREYVGGKPAEPKNASNEKEHYRKGRGSACTPKFTFPPNKINFMRANESKMRTADDRSHKCAFEGADARPPWA